MLSEDRSFPDEAYDRWLEEGSPLDKQEDDRIKIQVTTPSMTINDITWLKKVCDEHFKTDLVMNVQCDGNVTIIILEEL